MSCDPNLGEIPCFHVSKNWKVLQRKKYTDSNRKGLGIGIFFVVQGLPNFRTRAENMKFLLLIYCI